MRAPLARDRAMETPAVAQWQPATAVPPRSTRPVAHGHAVLAFFTEGRSRFEQGTTWELHAGDVIVVPAGSAHRTLEADGSAYWGLAVATSSFVTSAPSLVQAFERVRAGATPAVTIPGERHEHLAHLFRELAALDAPADEVRRSLATLILYEVTRAAAWNDDAPQRTDVVTASLRFIERRCLGKLSLADVARAVGRSPAYVTTALTRATGRSAGEWITLGRMAEARRLLLLTSERVDAIGERIGYADPTHFIRTFRRAHGVTPAAWRSARARP